MDITIMITIKNLFDSYGAMRDACVRDNRGKMILKNNKYGVAPNAQIFNTESFSMTFNILLLYKHLVKGDR